MQQYKRTTQEIITRFLGQRLNFPNCIASLDLAFPGRIPPELTDRELVHLRRLMFANNKTVMKEMERRARPARILPAPLLKSPRNRGARGRERATANTLERSEERRVGKECRSRWSPY